jgi:hypothetical protein
MDTRKTLAQWMDELGIDVGRLTAASGLDGRTVEAIVARRYTTSPRQRERGGKSTRSLS